MGLRGFFDALTKIAAQPDKDFGELVRQRRRNRGLLVAPAGQVLPFLPACRDDDPAEHVALDAAAVRILQEMQEAGLSDDLHAARVRLAEWRLREAFAALEEAERCGDASRHRAKLEAVYDQALKAYESLG